VRTSVCRLKPTLSRYGDKGFAAHPSQSARTNLAPSDAMGPFMHRPVYFLSDSLHVLYSTKFSKYTGAREDDCAAGGWGEPEQPLPRHQLPGVQGRGPQEGRLRRLEVEPRRVLRPT
jgi:hypothetical protein